MKHIGFIGLGIMGKPMAANLLSAGVSLFVYDVNPQTVQTLVCGGAKPASPQEMGSLCDIVFLSLPNGAISQQVLFQEDGLASSAKPGCLIIDTSSVTPVQSQECAQRLKEKQLRFMDCPVSGGEPGAKAGTLAFMAGGCEEDFQEAMPYFDIMGSSAILVGDTGSGSVTKLANQIIVNTTIAAVSEALVLATKAGADPEKVYQAIRSGLAGSAVLDAKAPMMYNRNFQPGGKISINRKDIRNVIDTAHELNVPVPLSSQLFEIFQVLNVAGHMDDDHSGIVQYFEQLAKVTVRARSLSESDTAQKTAESATAKAGGKEAL